MRVSDEDGLTGHVDFNRRLRTTLKKVKLALGVPQSEFADMAGMSPRRLGEVMSGRAEATIFELNELACSARLNLGLLYSGQIDFVTLALQFRGDREALPARYTREAHRFSRIRGIKTMYHYLRVSHGEEYAQDLFTRLQVLPELLTDPEEFVSPLLGADLMAELKYQGFAPTELQRIGTFDLMLNNGPTKSALARLRQPKRLYEGVFGMIPKNYDRAFSYRLEALKEDGCVMVTEAKEELVETFKTRAVGSREICLFKQGVTMSWLALVEDRFADVAESECIYRGDRHCRYHISWS